MITMESIDLFRGKRQVLKRVTAHAAQGKTLGLIGPNGAGKSTLLNTIYKALIPNEGRICIDDEPIDQLRRKDIAQRIAVVAQHGEASLPLTVRDSVSLGRLAKESVLSYGNKEDVERVNAALARVGLTSFADRLTNELSGGELQRVLIARAIVQEADHLLLDEPTNHLDLHHQYRILQLVNEIPATTVIVLHDLNLAAQFCDELVLLNNGEVVAVGPPLEVLTSQRVSEVYRIGADVVTHNGRTHLVFHNTPQPSKEVH